MKAKLITVMLVACVVSAVASATASAANEYFEEGVAVKKEKIEAKSTSVSVEAKITGAKEANITGLIECPKSTSTGEFLEKGKGKGATTFEGCKLWEATGATHKKEELTNCKVPNFKFEYESQLEERNAVTGATTALKPPKAEETFAEIVIEGAACQVPGTYKLKGAQQKCTNDESLFGEELHTIVCNGVGNALKLAAQSATIYVLNEVKLEGKKRWYME